MASDEGTRKRQLLEELAGLRTRVFDLETRLDDYRQTIVTIEESESRYRRIFESARDGVLILDAETRQITEINPFLIEMLGLSREELLGKNLSEVGPLREINSSKAILNKLMNDGYVRCDLRINTGKGRHLVVEMVGALYLVGNKNSIQCCIRDVTECRSAEVNINYLSTHDELTKLHNRMFFDEEMSRLGRGRQYPITIIIADVDGLKQINERLSHAAGDEMLKRAAFALRETFRADEVLARIGGDKFAVMLPETDAATAQAALDRVRNKLYSLNASQTALPLSLSLGAATANASGSLAEALKQADEPMHEEKMAHKLERLNRMPRNLQLIFEQIDAKLSARPGIHISRLASELACERHVIERATKAVKSMQFREYQQTRRLETALHLLADKPLLIKEIAGALGYKSPTSLWRLCKTRMGKSPSDTRAL